MNLPLYSRQSSGFTVLEIVLATALVLVIGAVGYYAVTQSRAARVATVATTPTPSASAAPVTYQRTSTVPATWKTYTSPAYGVSFAYAPNWRVTPDSKGNPSLYDYEIGLAVGTTTQSYDAGIIGIKAESLETAAKNYESGFLKQVTLLKATDIVYDGNPGKEYRIKNGGFTERQYLIYAHGKTFIPPVVDESDEPGNPSVSAHDTLVLFESIKFN